jgi:hypothetical protein
VVPALTPVTTPADTDATAVLLLLHEPPLTASVRVIVDPGHTVAGPLMVPAEAPEVTVTVVVTAPHDSMYVIIVVPEVIPDTTPLPEPMVATEVLLLLQVPPDTLLLSVLVVPVHTVVVPVIGDAVFTVMPAKVALTPQILEAAYAMTAVPPDTPVAIPEELMVAMETSLLNQKPPGVASLREVVVPTQTTVEPVIGAIAGTVLIDAVAVV